MRVLLAVDGSIHALRAAQFLLGLAGERGPMELHVLNVQPPVRYLTILEAGAGERAARMQLEAGREAAASVCALLEGAALQYELHVVSDEPAEAIVRLARERSCGMIVMGTRGMGAIANLVLGSVALKVIHLAEVPVTLVK